MDLSIDNLQLKDSAIELAKLVEGSELVKRDGNVAMSADLNLGSNKISNLSDGVLDTDAVSKGQLDTEVSTLSDATLKIANNLSDVADVATARTNLDVYSTGETDSAISTAINGLSAGLIYKGTFDASAGDFSAMPDASQGDFYKVSVWGTIEGHLFTVGDMIIVNSDVVGTPVLADVDVIDNTEAADILRDGDVSTDVDLSVEGTKLTDRATIASYIANLEAAKDTEIYGQEQTVTNGLSTVTLPIIPTLVKCVTVNGNREYDFTVTDDVIDLGFSLKDVPGYTDRVHVDFNHAS